MQAATDVRCKQAWNAKDADIKSRLSRWHKLAEYLTIFIHSQGPPHPMRSDWLRIILSNSETYTVCVPRHSLKDVVSCQGSWGKEPTNGGNIWIAQEEL